MRSCPACGKGQRTPLGEKNGFAVSSCDSCRTMYAHCDSGAPTHENYDAYYNAGNLEIPAFVDRRLDEIVKGFAPFRGASRLLDVGCGAGALLQAARRAGWQANGIDVSEAAVVHVRKLGFNVFHGEIDAAGYESGQFDVVTATECIEHIETPLDVATEIHRVLRKGGLLWGTSPHGRGLSSRVLGIEWSTVTPPEHLQLFSVAGLRVLLQAAGFRDVHVVSRGLNPVELWHTLSRRLPWRRAADDGVPFDRVASSYALNAALTRNAVSRTVKGGANALLRISSLGDSIEFFAIASGRRSPA